MWIALAPAAGFDWTASVLGAVAGFGIALVLLGCIALVRATRR
jgi:hypothetical protein